MLFRSIASSSSSVTILRRAASRVAGTLTRSTTSRGLRISDMPSVPLYDTIRPSPANRTSNGARVPCLVDYATRLPPAFQLPLRPPVNTLGGSTDSFYAYESEKRDMWQEYNIRSSRPQSPLPISPLEVLAPVPSRSPVTE